MVRIGKIGVFIKTLLQHTDRHFVNSSLLCSSLTTSNLCMHQDGFNYSTSGEEEKKTCFELIIPIVLSTIMYLNIGRFM